MATTKNITMKQFNGTDYDTLYPETIAAQIPDVYSQNQTLSSSVSALYGLGSNATPNDVFGWIGKYNQYWWKRTPAVWHDAYATLGDVTSVETGGYSSGSSTYSISYSKSYSVDSFGNVTLVSPSTLSVSYNDYTAMNALKGRYFKSNLSSVPGVYFVSADAPDATKATIDSVRYVYIDGAKLIGHAQGYTYGSVELVNSSNRNAYPDSGVHEGYEYEYLGIPFENFFNQVKIAIGSYVGTGTYGADNPNEITIGFEPKLIILNKGFYGVRSSSDANSSANGVSVFFGDGTYAVWQYPSSGTSTFNSTILDLLITHTGVTWYYNGSYNYDANNQNCPALQLNDSGITYTYVAFG